jgi:hypothetical protein
MITRQVFADRRQFVVCSFAAALFTATSTLIPRTGNAQQDKVHTSMGALKARTAQLGVPKIAGSDKVDGKDVPALYFGPTRMNNFFEVVDDVVEQNGGTATIFVKADNEYVRVATNVKKQDGSRAIGTILDPEGPAIAMIRKGEAYYGDAMILGKPYVTGYEPIRDASGSVIGIYYVGYLRP